MTSPLNKRKIVSYCTISFLVYAIILFANTPTARADPLNVVEFTNPGGETLQDNIFFDVKESGADTDCSEKGAGPISVTIKSIKPDTSIRDTITLQAIEINNPLVGFRNPTSNTCIFGNTFLYFSPDNQRFPIESMVTITQKDTSGGKDSNGIIDTITVTVTSTSTPGGTSLTLTETGPNTGIFQGQIKFTAGATIPNSALHVSSGDIITSTYLGIPSYGQIQPSPNGSSGLLVADVGDTIQATYNGFSGITTVCVCGGPGGGGGGLIRPGLVLDIVAALGAIGGSPYIVQPPSFGGLGYHFSDGLTFTQVDNKTIHDISHYNQELPRQVMVPGDRVNMTFKTYESYYSEGVIHMGLYLIPRGHDMITPKSIASIEWNKGKPVMMSDPGNILSHVNASSSSDGKFQYTQFVFTPTKSYDKMSFLVRAWNDHLYSTDTRIHDAIDVQQVINSTLPYGTIRYENFTDLQQALHKDQFYKPEILSRIHDTGSVFPSQQGKVYWLYDTIDHFVTLVISDENNNELFSQKSSLQPYDIEKKGDYKFMHFTVKQLDRWDTDQMQKAMKLEEEKALSIAIEKRIIPQSNW